MKFEIPIAGVSMSIAYMHVLSLLLLLGAPSISTRLVTCNSTISPCYCKPDAGECSIDCFDGSCTQTCSSTPCSLECIPGWCTQSCWDSTNCTMNCLGGHCIQKKNQRNCIVSCDGGFCNQSSPAGEIVYRTCKGGNCYQWCDIECVDTCEGGNCYQESKIGTNPRKYCSQGCTQKTQAGGLLACSNGSCIQSCYQGTVCNMTCDGGNCLQTRELGEVFASCLNGGCTQTCSDSGLLLCEGGNCIQSCTKGCIQNCQGDCNMSCSLTNQICTQISLNDSVMTCVATTGGYCKQDCGSNCDLSCTTGKCQQTITSGVMTCDGGSCNQYCRTSNCTMSCKKGCNQNCPSDDCNFNCPTCQKYCNGTLCSCFGTVDNPGLVCMNKAWVSLTDLIIAGPATYSDATVIVNGNLVVNNPLVIDNVTFIVRGNLILSNTSIFFEYPSLISVGQCVQISSSTLTIKQLSSTMNLLNASCIDGDFDKVTSPNLPPCSALVVSKANSMLSVLLISNGCSTPNSEIIIIPVVVCLVILLIAAVGIAFVASKHNQKILHILRQRSTG